MRVLVIGATGNVGVPTVLGLLERGADVRVLVRNEGKARELFAGVGPGRLEIVAGELTDSATVAAAVPGADVAFLALHSVGPSGELQRAVIGALAEAGLPRLVRLSVLSTSHTSPGLNQRGHAVLDDVAEATGLVYTSLRPAIFMTAVLDAAAQVRVGGGWIGTAETGRNPLIDPRDVATTAVEVLLDPAKQGQHYDLTGPALYSWSEAASALADVLGRPVEFTVVDEPTLREKAARRVPDWMVELLLARERAVETGDNERLTDWVQRLTGAAPRTLQAYLREHRAEFLPVTG
ncbi:MAG TPA: NAD(P)H-binding protein [Pseudonocardia sp.]|nr:NAD(P)H-binding protein [Pseudonocardia sp.]